MTSTDDGSRPEPEGPEEFHARILAATDAERRLPRQPLEDGPSGWDIYPYESESLRLVPVRDLAEAEPARRGENPAECRCHDWVDQDAELVWRNDRWRLIAENPAGLPIFAVLQPYEHHDLGTLPPELAAEMGQLMVAIGEAIEQLPSVGRCHVGRWGDGGAHLHLCFLGRPARATQFRGSPLLDWEEHFPRVPEAVLRANAAAVAQRLTVHLGGRAGPFAR